MESQRKWLTVTDMRRVFRKNDMTLYLWRTKEGLPFKDFTGVIGGTNPIVRYNPKQVKAWANKKKKILYEDPENVLMNDCENKKVRNG